MERDPLQVLEELTKQKARFTASFHDEYQCYLEVLMNQLFEPNGYILTAIKKDT